MGMKFYHSVALEVWRARNYLKKLVAEGCKVVYVKFCKLPLDHVFQD